MSSRAQSWERRVGRAAGRIATVGAVVYVAACAPGDAERGGAAVEPSAPAALGDLPLRRDDPRAQLPREYLDYPPEPPPALDADTGARARTPAGPRRTVRYIAATGAVDTLDLPASSALAPDDEHTPGSYGALPPEGVAPAETPAPTTVAADDGTARAAQAVVAPDTLAWPARAAVKLFITHSDGTTGACSGVMVSPRHVLTAGHCVYARAQCSPTTGLCGPELGWQRAIRAVPGLSGTYMPYGSAQMLVAYADTDWVYGGTSDIGLVVLDRNLGSATGYFGIYAPGDFDLTGGTAYRIQGYPAEGSFAPGLAQHFFDASGVTLLGTQQFQYFATNPEGMSGSGVRSTNHGAYDRLVAGVNVANELVSGRPTGRGIAERMTASRMAEINRWISDTSWLPVQGGDYTNWDFRSDGARTNTPPAVVVRAGTSDAMFLTYRARDTGATWVRPWTAAGGWGPSENIGGITTHRPAGVSRMPGFYDAFVRGTDGQIYSKWRNAAGAWGPSQTGWFALPWGAGDVAAAEPAVVSWGSNRLDVFMVGVSGGVFWQFWNGAAWSGWQRISPAGFSYAGSAAAVTRGVGLLDAVAYGAGTVGTGGAYGEPAWGSHFYCTGACTAASDWRYSLNGPPTGAPGARPAIVASSSTRVDFFVHGYGDTVMHSSVEGGVYAAAEELGGLTVVDDVAAVSRSPGVLEVFARGADGRMYQRSRYGASASWGAWTSLGGDFLGVPAVASRSANNLEVFGRDTLDRVISRSWNACTLRAFNCGWTPYATRVFSGF